MTISRIAVGVDFSVESQHAVDHAMAVARRLGATLTLVHVGIPAQEGFNDLWREVLLNRQAEVRDQLAALHQRLSGQGVEISQVVIDGYADVAIAGAARELGAAMVVVGTRGRTGLRRVMLGSVAEKTARLADGSVLVVRGDAAPGGYRRVVVGTDHSPLAQRAIELALAMTAPGGEVQVLHAWSAPFLEYDLSGRMLADLREAADQVATGQRERLLAMSRPAGVTLRLDVRDGFPLEILEAESGSADLIVVGTHGRRGVRRFFLGSVAEATVRHARCSVLVAR